METQNTKGLALPKANFRRTPWRLQHYLGCLLAMMLLWTTGAWAQATLPYTENFGTNTFTFVNGTQTNKWAHGSATGNPTNAIYVSNDNGTSNAYTNTTASVVHAYREISIPAGATQAQFSFQWKCAGETNYDYLRVWLVPNSFTPTAGTQITSGNGRIQVSNNFSGQGSAWQTYTNNALDLSSFANTTMRLVFEWRNDGSLGTQPPAAVDNVSLALVTCFPTTATAATNIAATTASANWSTATGSWIIEYGPTATFGTPGTGASAGNVNNTVVTASNVSTKGLTSLTPATGYSYVVRKDCSGGGNGYSANSNAITFTTACNAVTSFPWAESFNNASLPTCWTQQYVSGTFNWATVTTNGNSTITPHSGARMAEFRNTTYGSATRLVTPLLDLTSLTNPELTFYFANVNWAGDIDELRVYYSTDGGTTWTLIPGQTYTTEHTAWHEVKVILPSPNSTYKVAFESTFNYARGLDLDDVSIAEALPLCTGTPAGGTASFTPSSGPSGSTATGVVSGYETGSSGLTYDWEYSTDGGTTWTSTEESGDNEIFTITGQHGTVFQIRYAVGCTPSSMTGYSNIVTFTVDNANCVPPDPAEGCFSDNITTVNLGTLSEAGLTCTPYYEDRTSVQNAVPDLTRNATISLSVGVGSGGTEYVGVWIDYDGDGAYENAEYTALGSGNGVTVTGNITVPGTALAGTTKMRVRTQFDAAFAAGDACAQVYYGTTRDYAVNIVCDAVIPDNTAGTYSATVDQADGTTQAYTTNNCASIGSIADASGGNVLGNTTMTATVDASNVLTSPAGYEYVRRSFTVTPTSNGAADLTFYFSQEDFDVFNSNNAHSLDLPAYGTDPNVDHIRVTKYANGVYTAPSVPMGSNLSWDGTRWVFTLSVTSVGDTTYYFGTHTDCSGVGVSDLAAGNLQPDAATWTWTTLNINYPYTGYEFQYRVLGDPSWISAGTANNGATSKLKNGLATGTTYEVQARSKCNMQSSGPWSSSVQFTTTSSGCNSPMTFNVPTSTASTVSLSWPSVSGAGWYSFEYKETSSSTWLNAGTANGSATSKTISGLNANTSYDFRGRTHCPSGTPSAYSTVATISTTALAGCALPPVLSANPITGTSATINWTAVVGAGWYAFRYKETSSSTWISYGTANGSATSKVLSGLVSGTQYDFEARTYCPNGQPSAWSSPLQFTTVSALPCEAPPALSTDNVTTTTAKLSWPAIAGAGWFEFRYKETNSNTWLTAGTANGSATAKTFVGLTAGTQYDYQARTYCSQKLVSAWSATHQLTTQSNNNFAAEDESKLEELAAQDGHDVFIFPNPANDIVHIRLSTAKAILKITDVQGREIKQMVVEKEASISLTDVAPGIYFFEVKSDNGTTVKRVVKQ